MKAIIIQILVEIGKWAVKYLIEMAQKAKEARERVTKEVKENAKIAKAKLRDMSRIDIIRGAIRKGRSKNPKDGPKPSNESKPNDHDGSRSGLSG